MAEPGDTGSEDVVPWWQGSRMAELGVGPEAPGGTAKETL
jgi:hypothetical protein